MKRNGTGPLDTTPSNLGVNLKDFVGSDEMPDDQLAKLEEMVINKKISEWIRRQYKACKLDATTVRNQWYLNLGFYKGDQYVTISNGRLLKAPNVPGRVRMVINRTRSVVRTELSRMTSQQAQISVVPASSEDEDIIAAEAGEQIWEHHVSRHKIPTAFKQAAFWASITGIGYVKTMWDSECEYINKPGEPKMKGDLHYEAPTPFHIFVPDVLELDIQRQPYVLHAYTMTIEEVKSRFGDKIDKDKTPSVISTNEIFETRYLNVRAAEQSANPDSCLVIEAWVKPFATNLLPEGGLVIIVDETVVFKSDKGLPYHHGKYPFSKIDNVPSGGYYSTSVIEDLIYIQKEINRNRSQVIENRNATAKPGYFVQQGSVDTNKWTSKPGQLIPVLPGFQNPQPMQVPQLPAYIAQEHENMLRDIEDISGQHQVSKGGAPSGVTAATAINFLQERDDSYMAPVYVSLEDAWEDVAAQTLQLVVQYWDQARIVKATGEDMAFSAKAFVGADISNATDVKVERGSALPVSRAARQALFMDMMNRGLMPPDKGLELMELPNMRGYYQLVKKDERHATRENIKLANVPVDMVIQAKQEADMKKQMFMQENGFMDENEARMDPATAQILDIFDEPMLPVNDWDNDEVHIFVHQNFMKSQRFEMLDPAVQEEFIKHVQAHKMKTQAQQLTALMQGGVSGGPSGGAQGAMPGMGQEAGGGDNGTNQFSAPSPNDGAAGQPTE